MNVKNIAACMMLVLPSLAQAEVDIPHKHLHFFSPHPDDILLTFGGLIHKLSGQSTLPYRNSVTEVFFGLSNYTTNHLDVLTNKRISDVSTQRFTEDFLSHISMFGSWKHFRYQSNGYYDAPLRLYQGSTTAGGGPAGTFLNFRAAEQAAYEDIVEQVKPTLKKENCAAFVLLANGSHIDHFIVREAVMKAAAELGNKAKCEIYFGEDQPYTGANPSNANDEIDSMKARLPAGAITKFSYWIDKKKKIDTFQEYYLSQYDAAYLPPLDSSDFENVYRWDPSTYSALQSHQNCSGSYCKIVTK